MSINIRARSDMTYLFSSLGSAAAGTANSNFLSDYASIKNGSYGKLMKAYYGGVAKEETKTAARSQLRRASYAELTKEESRTYAKVQTTTDSLKESADALLGRNLFKQTDVTVKNADGTESVEKGYDREAIYKAVSSFVKDYNSVVSATGDAKDTTLARRVRNMENLTAANEKALAAVGITRREDGTLSLGKEEFDKADMLKVKSLFNGNGSYGYQVSAQASLINYAADHVISRGSAYTSSGTYGVSFNNGSLYSSYF